MFGHIGRKYSRLVEDALQHKNLTRDEICYLLSVGENSPEANFLIDSANRYVLDETDGIGEIGVQIGLHIGPCIANCGFCSFAVSNAYFTEFKMSESELGMYLDKVVSDNTLSSVSLMTIHDFDFDMFLERAEFAHQVLPGGVRLVSNTGDLEEWQAKELKRVGIDSAYHSLRLREGIINSLEPFERFRTIQYLCDAGIRVLSGIEPIGPEHSVEEIVDGFLQARDMGCHQCSASARESVPGTPLFHYGDISSVRLQQIRSALLLGTLGSENGRFYGGVYGGFDKILCEYSSSPKDLDERSEFSLGRTVSWGRSVLKSRGFTQVRCIDGSIEDL